MWRWNLRWARFSLPKLRNDLSGFFVFPMVNSKDDNEVYTVEKLLRRDLFFSSFGCLYVVVFVFCLG